MNKKTLLILLFIILIFSLNVYAQKVPTDQEKILESAEKNIDKNPEEAFFLYNLAYINSNDEKEKEKIKNKIKKFRKKHNDKRGYGHNRNKNVHIELLPLTETGKINYGVESYKAYKMFIFNNNKKDIKFNSIMTKITALPKNGVQVEAVDPLSIMNLDIPIEKLNKLQNSLPANQTVYSESIAEMIVVFEKNFTPKKIIIDEMILGDSLDKFRIDVLFIGL